MLNEQPLFFFFFSEKNENMLSLPLSTSTSFRPLPRAGETSKSSRTSRNFSKTLESSFRPGVIKVRERRAAWLGGGEMGSEIEPGGEERKTLFLTTSFFWFLFYYIFNIRRPAAAPLFLLLLLLLLID